MWKIELEEEDIYFEPPLEGGPKTAELPEELVDSKRLIEVLNINPELSPGKGRNFKMLSPKTIEHWV
jgi:hypothetical protein